MLPWSKRNNMSQSIRSISIVSLAALLSLFFVSFANAEVETNLGIRARVNAGTTTKAEVRADVKARVDEKRIDLAKDRGIREIERRGDHLMALMDRIEDMVRLPESEKDRITALLQTQIDSLVSLKGRIEAASDIDSLKTDIRSIKDSYRVFVLTIPQTRVTVAAEKIKATAETMAELSVKLERHIAEANAQGKETARLSASLADMKTQLSEATANADAALRLVASLTPDNGDAAKAEANMKALREAQAKLKAGHENLKQARQDAGAILKGLREFGVRTDVKASAPASQ